jgi:hypothetical protein
MILPHPVDLQVASGDAFFVEAGILKHADRSGIPGRGFPDDPVKLQLLEGIAYQNSTVPVGK